MLMQAKLFHMKVLHTRPPPPFHTLKIARGKGWSVNARIKLTVLFGYEKEKETLSKGKRLIGLEVTLPVCGQVMHGGIADQTYLMRYCLNSGLAIFWPNCDAQEAMVMIRGWKKEWGREGRDGKSF